MRKRTRWNLLRDVVAFQLKLVADALRDLFLSPISLGCAVAGILFLPDQPDRYFRHMLIWGRRSERLINLFGNYSNRRQGIDDLVDQLERRVVEQYHRGGMTASAKNAIDAALDTVAERLHGRVQPPEPPATADPSPPETSASTQKPE